MLNVAVIGCGYWGINYVRVFDDLPGAKLGIVCDPSEDRLRSVRHRFPLVTTTPSIDEALGSKWVDAVVIATPAATHHAVVKKAILAGKHVLAEKPITTRIEDGLELIDLAKQHQRVLMTGHTFLFNPGIRKVKEIIRSEQFGKMYYLHATRTNMGPVRQDVNALWDLAAHDISIFNYLLEARPEWVSTVASRPLGKTLEDVGFATLHYPGGILANIHVSWIDPNKVREVVAVGSRQRVVFDDMSNVERVRIFEKGMAFQQEADSFGEFKLLVRDGDIISPHVPPAEPLKLLGEHFVECCQGKAHPLSDGQSGVEVVRALCAMDRSLRLNGAAVEVA